MTKVVGLVVHRTNQQAWDKALEVVSWLTSQSIDVELEATAAARLHLPHLARTDTGWGGTDFVISLGGDGTILSAARMAAPDGVPVLGVHMGRFGFIAEAHPAGLNAYLQRALHGHVRIEERLMISAEIWRDDQPVHRSIGLNDAVVKSGSSSLLHLVVQIGGGPFATYPADGVIVATPTGSTGYSLSAGGPIVEPTLQALVVTPICPHTLSARPMVIPSHHTVELELEADDVEADALFKIDGLDAQRVAVGDRVVISRSEYVTRLIQPEHSSFYRKVRARYLYGERLNATEPQGP